MELYIMFNPYSLNYFYINFILKINVIYIVQTRLGLCNYCVIINTCKYLKENVFSCRYSFFNLFQAQIILLYYSLVLFP